MRSIALLTLCFAASFTSIAHSSECDRWVARIEEEEGGPQMMASICTDARNGDADAQHAVYVQCTTGDSLMIRYLPVTDERYPPGGNEEYQTRMRLAIDGKTFDLDARFESMDGAMAMDLQKRSPAVSALTGGQSLVVSDAGSDKLPAVTFPLAGAKKALETLIKTCE
jgi:hypothetical protein